MLPRSPAAPKSRCRPGFEELEPRDVPTVSFYGGYLLRHVQVQALYIGSDWATSSVQHRLAGRLDTFLNYLVNSPYLDLLNAAGYGVDRGSFTRGVIDPVVLNKRHDLSDATIQSILASEVNTGQLARPSVNRLYVVFVEPGVVVNANTNPHIGGTSVNDFDGYHDAVAPRRGQSVAYAVIPYHSFNNLTETVSHEVAESVTDPGLRGTTGWYDTDNNGEIADLADGVSRLHGYWLEDIVDQNDNTITPADLLDSRLLTAAKAHDAVFATAADRALRGA